MAHLALPMLQGHAHPSQTTAARSSMLRSASHGSSHFRGQPSSGFFLFLPSASNFLGGTSPFFAGILLSRKPSEPPTNSRFLQLNIMEKESTPRNLPLDRPSLLPSLAHVHLVGARVRALAFPRLSSRKSRVELEWKAPEKTGHGFYRRSTN